MDKVEQVAIETMRTIADYFPIVKVKVIQGVCYAASYIRVYKGKIWYKVFYVEKCNYSGVESSAYLLQSYVHGAYWFSFTYEIDMNTAEVDNLQVSEKERQVIERYESCRG